MSLIPSGSGRYKRDLLVRGADSNPGLGLHSWFSEGDHEQVRVLLKLGDFHMPNFSLAQAVIADDILHD